MNIPLIELSWQRFIVTFMVGLTAIYCITGCLTRWETCYPEDYHRGALHTVNKTVPVLNNQKLVVIVPIHQGDQDRAIESLQQWPKTCHPLTTQSVDLVIYKAEKNIDEFDLARVADGPAKCFRQISIVSGNLQPEENVYPKGASVQFYKLFLDSSVRERFVEYDALAIIEWDVIVAHDTSFERLYKSAFTSSEPFWVKGSSLIGSEFLGTASLPQKWHILGHLNGNAIYNNTDPAFIEFVNFTFSRWGFRYSYDVALWATISDFPYSWPLWQRYSPKFVATNLISNIGFHDVTEHDVLNAVAVDTLFIHGSTKSLGSTSNSITRRRRDDVTSTGCTAACGSVENVGGVLGIFTTCDATCLNLAPNIGYDHERSSCGAGNPAKFGPACRVCYDSSHHTLEADNATDSSNAPSHQSEAEQNFCRAVASPESTDCTQECYDDVNTVCDSRCGRGLFGDFHCNWRGLGKTCRFCFRDVLAARIADKVAMAMGGRVVMCDIYGPPLDGEIELATPANEKTGARHLRDSVWAKQTLIEPSGARGFQEPDPDKDHSATEFAPNITLGQICAFILGYPDFQKAIGVSVHSINLFMPGMRVAIATSPSSFHIYNSTLGQVPEVSVVISSRVQYAAVEADRACGHGTKLILYMSPGQILSRPFTTKDTHSLKGELVVMYTLVGRSNEAYVKRSLASAALLGFHPPSFTLGTDLILPVEINKHLRAKLLATGSPDRFWPGKIKERENEFQVIQNFLDSMSKKISHYAIIDIREVLAAEAYHQNWNGVQFNNLRQWNRQNIFRKQSIWDVPLIKPRFGCILDVSLHLSNDNVADELQMWVDAFSRGAKCEIGFVRPISNSLSPIAKASPDQI